MTNQYGVSSVAPNISDVYVYEAVDWINNVLNYGKSLSTPIVETHDVQNHSWIGNEVSANALNILKRLDFAIQRDDFVSVVGLNNGAGNDANLLSEAYNVISVGRSGGSHSYAPTNTYDAGRQRTHIVVPTVGTTSEATGVVSSASAFLVNTARSKGFSNGDKSETIKAVLMAGATKTDVPNWSYAVHGAGELNIQNSYNIMARGEQTAGGLTTLAASSGWDFSAVSSSQDQVYRIYADQNSPLSVVLTWNAVVSASGGNYNNLTTTVADLDLKVYFSNDSTLGTLQNSTGSGSGGLSTIDNVEHLWWENVNAGYYSFVISSKSSVSTEYALAWQAVPEPSRALLILAGFVSIIWVRRRK